MRLRTTFLAGVLLVMAIVAACGDSEEANDPAANSEPVATSESTDPATTVSESVARATVSGEPFAEQVDLAPELVSVEAWYNSEPLTLEALRGEPVLLVFWATY